MTRMVDLIISAQATEDGAGVKLKRVFSSHNYEHTNPFVMLDEFGSSDANDYIAGFPSHPHKGFDTITFMLEGRMTHEDSTGNKGVISDFGVQWMRTGKGIIHSEMPAQTSGKMRGMQFWLNVPKMLKTEAPDYLDYTTKVTKTEAGNSIRVIAGEYAGQKTSFTPEYTVPQILFFHFDHALIETISIPEAHNALVYVLSGKVSIGDSIINHQQLGILEKTGSSVTITASKDAEILVLGARAIDEPMVQYGPFVMNTMEEIHKAFADYQAGLLG